MSGALDVDPSYLASLIGQNVELRKNGKIQHKGKCLSVDPVSGSLVLISGEKLLLIPWADVVIIKIKHETSRLYCSRTKHTPINISTVAQMAERVPQD